MDKEHENNVTVHLGTGPSTAEVEVPSSALISNWNDGQFVPLVLSNSGDDALRKFLEFFKVKLRNEHTRAAYIHAVKLFINWCETKNVTSLSHIEPMIVASYVDELSNEKSPRTVKQHLAAIRKLFNYLVVNQVLGTNPSSAVEGPRLRYERGLTPVIPGTDAQTILDSIDVSDVVGLRDRALIGILVYTFARVGAVVEMKVEDYYPIGKRWRVRLHEKGGKTLEIPVHHNAEEYLDRYVEAAGIKNDRKGYLFRAAVANTKRLNTNSLHAVNVYSMIRRRAEASGIETKISCHSFRATGITNYLENGGNIETAQKIAGHASMNTTRLYDRRDDKITLDEIERINLKGQ